MQTSETSDAPPPAKHGFAFDRHDRAKTADSLCALAERHAREGRTREFNECGRHAREAEALWALHERYVARRDPAPAPDPDAPPPPAPVVLRDNQRPPEGDWSTWLFLGGRGAGKTLAGALWLADQAERLGQGGRVALVGPTLHDVREVMVEGVSGILNLPIWTPERRPTFEPSRRRITFPGGAVAQCFSAEDPESLRGPQFSAAWADEFCAWPAVGARGSAETLALLRMGLRRKGPDGGPPRLVLTTTPKAVRALRNLMKEAGCEITRAATAENAAHLSPGFLDRLNELYGGTRRAAQELEGQVVELDGALFTAPMLAAARLPAPMLAPPMERIVVGLDPTTSRGGDACGIVVAGRYRRSDGGAEACVLADRSAAGLSPDQWARKAVQAAADFGAVAIVAEVNQGGEMVRSVLRTAGCPVRIREVRATEGKRARAEPVAALYEQGRVRHAGAFPLLEEELMAVGAEGEGALDRADALVWAVTDLLLDDRGLILPRIRLI